jgi:tetratricopeptide (TPR) repeat protein
MRRFNGGCGYRKGWKMIEAKAPVARGVLLEFPCTPILRNGLFLLLCMLGGLASVAQQAQAPAAASGPAQDLAAIRLLIDKGHARDALTQLDQMAAQKPEPAGVERLRGVALYAQNDIAGADRAFAAALQQDSKDVEAAQMRGLTLYRLGKPAETIALLEGMQQWAPSTRVDPSYILALCYMDVHRYDDARHAFARQYGFETDSAPAYLLTARMLMRRQNLQSAQEFARKALALNSQLPLVHLLLGEIALGSEQPVEALAEFEKERAQNPLYGPIYDRLGDVYERIGEYQKAQQVLQQALLLEPATTGPLILLGEVLLKRQDPASAAAYLERAEKLDPGNYMIHSLLGQAYKSMGRSEDAARQNTLTQNAKRAQTDSAPNQ